MLKLNQRPITPGHFPDGTLLIKENVPKDYTKDRTATITWQFENNEEMIALIYLTKHLKAKGVNRVHLDMPYIPNARQDRVKTDEDVFTLKYFAEVINLLEFASVTVLDPHSSVSEGLIDRIVVKSPMENIAKVIEKIGGENLLLFFPDEGAMKRYCAMTDIPYVYGMKKRDWKTGQISGLKVEGMIEKIRGSRLLIVDDICSFGGTFFHSAKALKELGAGEIYLYISHCENNILNGEVLTSGLVERVFTTDSIFTKEHERIEVLKYV